MIIREKLTVFSFVRVICLFHQEEDDYYTMSYVCILYLECGMIRCSFDKMNEILIFLLFLRVTFFYLLNNKVEEKKNK